MTRISLVSAIVIALATFGSMGASAQTAATWQTPAGGDASGNFLSVSLAQRQSTLRGTRRVERIDAPSGYTTGTLATVVLEGSEPEARRSIRVHLPYGAVLDLAAGDTVEVEARSERLGLGTREEVLVTRGGEIVILTTSRDRAGVSFERGALASRDGSRRSFAVRATIGGRTLEVRPGELAHVADRHLLVMGSETVYEGVRPPDAFDSRTLTVVRIRPRA